MDDIHSKIEYIKNNLPEVLKILNKNLKPKLIANEYEKYDWQFKLGNKWDEKKLDTFLATHQITLPLEYKLFLTQIGDGGAGFSFNTLSSFKELSQSEAITMSTPFPFTKAWLGYSNEKKYFQQCFDKEIIETYLYDLPREQNSKNGVIWIGSTPDHSTIELVLNGSKAGEVWLDATRYDTGGFFSTQKTFLTLYMEWIDNILLNKHSFDNIKIFLDNDSFLPPWFN